ncbi:PEP/pyruvate-binding domain-containing protein [Mesorhizobium norvegicum]|uniref:PEP/pyruvate-binding domain-containing protein n=1 Tax=Mesorhizobium sp. 10.2.3 TaxID=1085775 RepID=UPI0010A970DF
MKNQLGRKGANHAENLGLPVPPGFTITTEVCAYYYDQGPSHPERAQAPRHRAARVQPDARIPPLGGADREIAEMQARAILQAAVEAVKTNGRPVVPKVMVPLMMTKPEL